MSAPKKSYFRIHPTEAGFGFEVGPPDDGRGPSVDILGREFILYTRYNGMDAAEIGEMMSEVLAAVVAHDLEVLDRYPFVFKAYRGYEVLRRPAIPLAVRRRVMAVGKCAYCGSTDRLELDHIVPYSKGGAHEEHNFQCLCKKCNRRKYNKIEPSI
jgi:hypothetical protein